MTRRDMMIIAVLLNAGLLVILFATSLKSTKEKEELPSVDVLASHQPDVQEPVSIPATIAQMPSSPDQVDQVIQQYVTPQLMTSGQSANSASSDFLSDLQAIGGAVQSVAPKESSSHETFNYTAAPSHAHETVNYKDVKVKKGDVLERIARQNRVTVQDIMTINHLTSTRLKIGQVLKIPAAASSQENKPSSSEAQYYIVRVGDNPWTIAAKHHIKVEELLSLNNLDEQTARRLKAGDKLRIK